jgi:hypothetical protein
MPSAVIVNRDESLSCLIVLDCMHHDSLTLTLTLTLSHGCRITPCRREGRGAKVIQCVPGCQLIEAEVLLDALQWSWRGIKILDKEKTRTVTASSIKMHDLGRLGCLREEEPQKRWLDGRPLWVPWARSLPIYSPGCFYTPTRPPITHVNRQ